MPRRSRSALASGPQWRTAPGLSAHSTAQDHSADADPAPPGRDRPAEAPTPPPRSLERSARERTADSGDIDRRGAVEEYVSWSTRPLEPISDLEAAAFAGRFAADFQSFDEDDPGYRAEVLQHLLTDTRASTWGWSGVGRQRADSPLPGRIFRVSDTVVFVEVLVRVTSYVRARSAPSSAPGFADVEPVGLVGPSCAPPASDPHWAAVEANWVRMTVPVTRSADDGGLAVDPHLVPDQSD